MKFLKIILNAVIIVIVVITLLQIALDSVFPYSSEEKIIDGFQSDSEPFDEIVKYLISPEIEEIFIYDDGEKWTHEPEHIQGITDADIDRIIRIAKEKKYLIVEKTDSYIEFQLWANLDSSKGLIYSLIEEKPQKQYLTKTVPLSQKNWYYYETDINEYRRMRERGEVKD